MGDRLERLGRFARDAVADSFARAAAEKADQDQDEGYAEAAMDVLRSLNRRIDDLNDRAKQGTGLKAVESAQLAVLTEVRDEFVSVCERRLAGTGIRWQPARRVVRARIQRADPEPDQGRPDAT